MSTHNSVSSGVYEQKILESERMKALMDEILKTDNPRRELAANILISAPSSEIDSVSV